MADDSPTGGLPSMDDGSAASQTSKLKRSHPGHSSAAVDATAGTGIAGAGNNTRRSIAWDHFETIVVEGITRAECKHCKKTYKCDTRRNGTSSLLHHISVCKANPDVTEKKQAKLNLQPIAEGDEIVGSLTSWKFDQEAIRSELARMVIVDELPFRFVEGDGFKNFMSVTQPRFKIPSRWTVSRDCYQLYLDEKLKLRNYFKMYGKTISITTDTWTSVQKINYMCITAHYIDEEWSLNKKIINFCPIESHKGEDLGRQIDGCLRDWGISKVFSITVDNAPSNDTCLTYLKSRLTSRGCAFVKGKFLHMRCIAHIINLVVVDGINEIKHSIKNIRHAVRFVKQSPARLVKFRECCNDEGIVSKSLLCLDVSTRWNSTYLMLNVAQKFERAFDRYEMKDPFFRLELKHGPPSIVDWENARRMVDILSHFYELTLRISGTSYVTSNEFYHEISSVNCLLREWIASNDLDIKAMGEKMKSKYNKYWGDPKNVNHLIYVAVFVDPRYKLEFLEYALCEEHGEKNGSEIFKSVKGSVHELFEAYKLIYQPHCATSTQSTNRVSSLNESSHPNLSKNKSRYHLGDKFKRHKIESGEVESKCDLDVYLKESTLVVEKDDFDILRWWKLNQSRFPILSCFARDVLAIPISTVASESAFSTGGRVLDDYRSSLTPKIVEALICAQDWLKKKKSKWTKPLEESLEDIAKIEEALQGVGISDVNDNDDIMDLEE
ncbi:Zinc finger BED domain-containing protein DAYSLEEPER [Striga hermonthica]|uniref:Zinc finger BED domain-containing protein DAYSLEEPER n=1 Tax=Striga hermonthica TaxID=68872 RepID=A0A9N7MI67_STRHE|nr:Zinc finger BED domain-containing protein DAYSLEEPER [Striga hermonthica]